MKFSTALLAALALVSAPAFATSHAGTTTGPRGGVWSTNSATTCAGGSCRHNRATIAPNGTSATVNSSTTCANGACARSATRRGFYGRSISHQGTTTTP